MIEIKKIRVSGKRQNTISISSLTINFQYILSDAKITTFIRFCFKPRAVPRQTAHRAPFFRYMIA